jgi:alkanesulfonate monooxygenase SsuD/methylene tetrahydromethanopterin reductase-like flavin-dependent oxidoreductase (luciferase family)
MPSVPAIGFFAYLGADRPARDLLADTLAQLLAVEQCGLDSAWVAQHHFAETDGIVTGRLPSPLVFLAAVAARTQRIRLGTAVVVLPAEPALRLAEDAAVLQVLSGGRLELGLGSGTEPSVFAELGVDPAARSDLMTAHLAVLQSALAGDHLPHGHRLWPPATGVPLWQGVFSAERAEQVARQRCHLLLPKLAPAVDAESQAETIARYRAACPPGFRGRVALSRLVFPTTGDVGAELGDELAFQLTQVNRAQVRDEQPPWTREQYLDAGLGAFGTPAKVTEILLADPAVRSCDEVLLQFGHAGPGQADALRAIALLGSDVAPAVRGIDQR